jgi:hypothetical protein
MDLIISEESVQWKTFAYIIKISIKNYNDIMNNKNSTDVSSHWYVTTCQDQKANF